MFFRDIIKSIDKKEWLFVAILSFILIVITTIPYLYGFLNAQPDLYFTGRSSLNPVDIPNYYAYLEQAKQGDFLFKNLMTGEEQERLLFNPFLVAVGLLAKLFNISNPLIWQLARLLLIPVAAITLYILLSFFFEEKIKRKIGLGLLLFSSGLGAFAAPFLVNLGLVDPSVFWYYWPPDLWMPESITFMTLYHNPLHILSIIFIVLIFLFFLLAFENDKIKYSITAGFLSLILFLSHPYHVLTIYGITGIYLLAICVKERRILWKRIKHYLIIFFVSFLSPLYYYILLKYDPVRNDALSQWQSFTPAPWIMIIGFGLPAIFALIGILNIRKADNNKNIFIITWLAVGCFLIYCWFLGWPRRFTQGLQIPIIILSIEGIFIAYTYLKEKNILRRLGGLRFYVLPLAVFLSIFSNLTLIKKDLALFYDKSSYAYITIDAKEAIDWIKLNTPKDSVILTNPSVGSLVAGFSGRAVFAGHKDETINFNQKLIEANWFFETGGNAAKKLSFLEKNGIDYIFYYPDGSHPNQADYLEKIYENNEVAIYQVKN